MHLTGTLGGATLGSIALAGSPTSHLTAGLLMTGKITFFFFFFLLLLCQKHANFLIKNFFTAKMKLFHSEKWHEIAFCLLMNNNEEWERMSSRYCAPFSNFLSMKMRKTKAKIYKKDFFVCSVKCWWRTLMIICIFCYHLIIKKKCFEFEPLKKKNRKFLVKNSTL